MQKEKIPSLVNEYSQKIKRWSARAFSNRPVEKSKLLSILEAGIEKQNIMVSYVGNVDIYTEMR
jgi:hypothetical protein